MKGKLIVEVDINVDDNLIAKKLPAHLEEFFEMIKFVAMAESRKERFQFPIYDPNLPRVKWEIKFDQEIKP
jgi:hypothetical protein